MLSRINYKNKTKKTYKHKKNKLTLKKTSKNRKLSKNRVLKGGLFLDKGGFWLYNYACHKM